MIYLARWLDDIEVEGAYAIAEAHLAAVGLERHQGDDTIERRRYHGAMSESGAAVVSIDPSSGLWLSVDERLVTPLLPDRIADVLVAMSDELRIALGRTTHESMSSAVQREELLPVGHVRTLDWFQYFGASVACRWPSDVWDGLPDCWVTRTALGAVAVRFKGTPYGGNVCRHAAAALGIELPTVMGRNPATGEPIRIPHS